MGAEIARSCRGSAACNQPPTSTRDRCRPRIEAHLTRGGYWGDHRVRHGLAGQVVDVRGQRMSPGRDQGCSVAVGAAVCRVVAPILGGGSWLDNRWSLRHPRSWPIASGGRTIGRWCHRRISPPGPLYRGTRARMSWGFVMSRLFTRRGIVLAAGGAATMSPVVLHTSPASAAQPSGPLITVDTSADLRLADRHGFARRRRVGGRPGNHRGSVGSGRDPIPHGGLPQRHDH